MVKFNMNLRDQRVNVEANNKRYSEGFHIKIVLKDANGNELFWELTRRELAAVCREAAKFSRI